MNSKRSRLQRKYVNVMRGMADVPWPARRFKYPATLTAQPNEEWRCPNVVTVEWKRDGKVLGWFRQPKAKPVNCDSYMRLVPFKRRVECPACKFRAKLDRHWQARVEQPPKWAGLYARRASMRAAQTAGRLFRRRKV